MSNASLVQIVQGIVRHILTTLGGGLTAKGLISQDDLLAGISAVVTLIGIGWSVLEKIQRSRSAKPVPSSDENGWQRVPADKNGGGGAPKLPTLFAPIFILLAAGALTSCGTLDPSGPYGGDRLLYDADVLIVSAHATLDEFVRWEFQNREALSIWPEVRAAADAIRREAPSWILTAIHARDAYAAAPSRTARERLATALRTLRTALRDVALYMQRTQSQPIKQ